MGLYNSPPPDYGIAPHGNPTLTYPTSPDPMKGMMDPAYNPTPKSINPTGPINFNPVNLNDPNDPRNDPRNIRARQQRMLPPPPTGMQYGPNLGSPTAGFMLPGQQNNPAPPPLNAAQPWTSDPQMSNPQNPQYQQAYQRILGTQPGHPLPWRGYNSGQGEQMAQPSISPMIRPQNPSVGFRPPQGLMPGRASYSY